MTKKIATRDAYGATLVELGGKNPAVVVLDADLSKSTKTYDFGQKFPSRFFNMGIAEQNLMGTAAGLAAAGKIVFASTFAVFGTGRVYDQIRNSIAYPQLNVKIGATHAGLTVGEDGASHQMLEDIALMRCLPNMTVFVPADSVETRAAVLAAAEMDGPVYIRMGRSEVPVLHDEASFKFVPGKAVTLREGKDAAIVACGIMVNVALEAAETLAGQGVDVLVLDMHTIKPLDVEALVAAARAAGAVVTAEEHSINGGLGSAVAEVLVENYPVPMRRVGVRDTFGESGKPQALLEKYGLTAGDLVSAVQEVLQRKFK
ncbi:1-deoxy-D-xylulose-5-phosphate synthase [Sporotomaculum syntrophicum]|uniref:1-deoxy-D-xylulose-5-phosphate synthase n=1 Tax=Sporotomaculum syntrophicum TaxID=182264 RepID=A0A9D3AYI3_9FIRM|nr:transketolase family protein [Sporotomaculum syntrophicum]KAF1086112.1 1-deoxy-D-xylulose-5-phosphate synthase [Sporotomaculum syntrophicum]